MSDYTPHWQGTIRGFHTNGRDPWQVCVEMPKGPNIFDGAVGIGPTVRFDRGQKVHVLTDKGLADLKARALEEFAATWFPDAETKVRNQIATEPHEILETVASALHDHAQQIREGK